MTITFTLSTMGSIISASNSGLYKTLLAMPKVNLLYAPQPLGAQRSLIKNNLSPIIEHLRI